MWRLGEGEERFFSAGPQPAAAGPEPASFACLLGGRHDHSVRTEAQAGALGMNGAESAEASIPGVRIWGPVQMEQMKDAIIKQIMVEEIHNELN